MLLRKLIRRIRRKFFPTDHERMVDKWFADGGDEKLRFNYDLNPDSIVLDIGGYRGGWSGELFSRMPCQIHVFEPIPEFYKKLRQDLQKTHTSKSTRSDWPAKLAKKK